MKLSLAFLITVALGAITPGWAVAQSNNDDTVTVSAQQCEEAGGPCVIQRVKIVDIVDEAVPLQNDLNPDTDRPNNIGGLDKNWHFGASLGWTFGSHMKKEINLLQLGAGLHLRWSPRQHEGRLAASAGYCDAGDSGSGVALRAVASYAYRVADPIHIGLAIRGTSCYDWKAAGSENQIFRTFGGGPMVRVGPVRAFVDLTSFARFRPGQKRQMGGMPTFNAEVDIDFLNW